MNLSQRQIIILAGLAVVILGGGYWAFANLRSGSEPPKVNLTVWGTESKENFAALTGGYKRLRPNVTVNYVEKDPLTYDAELVDALAAGTGPDVVMVRNTSISRMQNKLQPVPETQFAPAEMELFPIVVSQDMVRDGNLYALPLYLDTLALFYNKEMFDQAGVIDPPATWEDFRRTVAQMRSVDAEGNIERIAAALGADRESVARATDIVQMMMVQNGTEILNQQGQPGFANDKGLNAFTYYLQFANRSSNYYTWNPEMGNSLDGFAAGEIGMILGYGSDLTAMKKKNPYLRAGTAPAPQVNPAQARSFARYQGLAVTKQSRVAGWAWDFIILSTTYAEVAEPYSRTAGRPPALKAIISKRMSDPLDGIFAKQALIARSWLVPDDVQAEELWNRMILEALSGREPLQAMRNAQQGLSSMY